MDDREHVIKGRQIVARLDRLPVWPYPFHFLLIVGIGFFFGFFDILTIGFALPRIEQSFNVSLDQATWTITSSLIGYIIGSFMISRIADLYGRKWGLIFSILFFSIGSFACAASFNLSWLIFWRFITGMGIGAEIATVTAFMEEVSPAAIRGRSTCTAIAFGMFGFAIVPFISYLLVPNFIVGWRILFVIGGIAGICIFYTRRHLPDSPRWLVIHNQLDQAEAIVARAEQIARQKYGELPEPGPISDQPMIRDTRLLNQLSASLLKRIVLFVLVWFFYYIGNYAWLTLAPSLLIKQGFDLSKSIGFIALSSFGFIVGSLISIFLSEKLERKWLAIIIALVWSLALFIIGWYPQPIVIVIAGFIATTTIATIIPILYIYTGENFPTRIRTTSLSITDGLGHLGGAFCGQIIFTFSHFISSNAYDFSNAFIIMAITGIITAILLLPGMKMTQRSLSDLAK
ncbi:MFS transporter [Aquicella lusitana]|uniref:Putative MFS transporter n=1 Tax=Aquicella lusitana TaxID=254246 RepID=A0A370GCP9_9COXI|nr:MFS transporter [Aquicella lusitana]RDI40990.1 putative MFS transporter [Aquicella lusitana]VVC73605.1 Putative niacin/nicotinamide transporter NaiP [Aquicella lusitana]